MYNLIILIVCVVVLAGAFILEVDQLGLWLFGIKWPMHCFLYHTFGIKCALCGLSRSFCSLADGDLAGSFGFHPLGPLLFFFTVFQVPYRLYAYSIRPRRIRAKYRRAHAIFAVIVLVSILVNWLFYLGGRLL